MALATLQFATSPCITHKQLRRATHSLLLVLPFRCLWQTARQTLGHLLELTWMSFAFFSLRLLVIFPLALQVGWRWRNFPLPHTMRAACQNESAKSTKRAPPSTTWRSNLWVKGHTLIGQAMPGAVLLLPRNEGIYTWLHIEDKASKNR